MVLCRHQVIRSGLAQHRLRPRQRRTSWRSTAARAVSRPCFGGSSLWAERHTAGNYRENLLIPGCRRRFAPRKARIPVRKPGCCPLLDAGPADRESGVAVSGGRPVHRGREPSGRIRCVPVLATAAGSCFPGFEQVFPVTNHRPAPPTPRPHARQALPTAKPCEPKATIW